MSASRPSQIRTYRIVGSLTILHSAVILGSVYGGVIMPLGEPFFFRQPLLWCAIATLLSFWIIGLALHPGRSIVRFFGFTIAAGALFAPCAPIYKHIVDNLYRRRVVAHGLGELSRANSRMFLYSVDQDLVRPMEVRKGYRRIGVDEVILPGDMFNGVDGTFARMDNLPDSVIPFTDPTVNDIKDENARSGYGHGWQILRRESNGSDKTETEVKAPSELAVNEADREPYKGPAVLGYVEITDPAEQRALLSALASGVTDSWDSALCHNPRHGLYVQSATATVDFSICFECQNVYLFGPDAQMGRFAHITSFAISRAPQPVFDNALKRHGITLSERTRH